LDDVEGLAAVAFRACATDDRDFDGGGVALQRCWRLFVRGQRYTSLAALKATAANDSRATPLLQRETTHADDGQGKGEDEAT
jgi:hypothetical protein